MSPSILTLPETIVLGAALLLVGVALGWMLRRRYAVVIERRRAAAPATSPGAAARPDAVRPTGGGDDGAPIPRLPRSPWGSRPTPPASVLEATPALPPDRWGGQAPGQVRRPQSLRVPIQRPATPTAGELGWGEEPMLPSDPSDPSAPPAPPAPAIADAWGADPPPEPPGRDVDRR
jgi:hypothetical protein